MKKCGNCSAKNSEATDAMPETTGLAAYEADVQRVSRRARTLCVFRELPSRNGGIGDHVK